MSEEDEDEGSTAAVGSLSACDREVLGTTAEETVGAARVGGGSATVDTGDRTVVREGTVDARDDVVIKDPVTVLFNDGSASAAAVGLKAVAFRWTLPGPVVILHTVPVQGTVIGLLDRAGIGDKESLASG